MTTFQLTPARPDRLALRGVGFVPSIALSIDVDDLPDEPVVTTVLGAYVDESPGHIRIGCMFENGSRLELGHWPSWSAACDLAVERAEELYENSVPIVFDKWLDDGRRKKLDVPAASFNFEEFANTWRNAKGQFAHKGYDDASLTMNGSVELSNPWRDEKGRFAPKGSMFSPSGNLVPDVGNKQGFDEITADEQRGDSRPVSAAEFQRLAGLGQAQLDEFAANSAPIDGLDENWDSIKSQAFDEAQESWGGSTIDARTGEFLPDGADKYALTVKDEGISTVFIPENSSRSEFNAAMDQAKEQFRPILERQNHYLGVFHDDDLNRIDIDPVTVVNTVEEVHTIGAATRAVGGAYNFADGNGYWPPYVDPSLSDDTATGPLVAAAGEDDRHFKGPGEWRRKAKQAEGAPDAPSETDDEGASLTIGGVVALSNPWRDENGRFAPKGYGAVKTTESDVSDAASPVDDDVSSGGEAANPWEDVKHTVEPTWDENGNIVVDPKAKVLAKDLREKAEQSEPEISARLAKLAGDENPASYDPPPDGELYGYEWRLKAEDKVAEKIMRELAEKPEKLEGDIIAASMEIKDAIRYTVHFKDEDFGERAQGIVDALRDEGASITVKNTWPPKLGKSYKGINAQVREPNGLRYEIQFHTENSQAVKDKMHKIYEQQRVLPNDSPEWKTLENEMAALSRDLPVPTGAVEVFEIDGEVV